MAHHYEQDAMRPGMENDLRGRGNEYSQAANSASARQTESGPAEREGPYWQGNPRQDEHIRRSPLVAGEVRPSGAGRSDYQEPDSREPHYFEPYPYGRDNAWRGDQNPWAGQPPYERELQAGLPYPRSTPPGQDYGFPGRGDYGQGQAGYGRYSSPNTPAGRGGYGASHQGGYGVGHSMQGLARYDQEYDSPSRGAYGLGGYGRGFDRDADRYAPRRSSSDYREYQTPYGSGGSDRFGMEDDAPVERGYAGANRGGGFRGLGPRGYKRSDERLAEDINERLTEDAHIDASDVSVEVKDGTVTLTGEVPERRIKHHIEDLVERCHGVQDIRNQITVSRGDHRSGETAASGRRNDSLLGAGEESAATSGQNASSAGPRRK